MLFELFICVFARRSCHARRRCTIPVAPSPTLYIMGACTHARTGGALEGGACHQYPARGVDAARIPPRIRMRGAARSTPTDALRPTTVLMHRSSYFLSRMRILLCVLLLAYPAWRILAPRIWSGVAFAALLARPRVPLPCRQSSRIVGTCR
jgi:hypothetical protein